MSTSKNRAVIGRRGASPLSAHFQERILRKLRDRAEAGEIAAMEALLRLGIIGRRTKPGADE